MSRRMSRFLAGTGIGIGIGFAWWLRLSYRYVDAPDSLSFAVAVWGLIGGLVGFFVDVPIVSRSNPVFEPPPARPAPPRGSARTSPGSAGVALDATPGYADFAPGDLPRAVPSDRPAGSTLASAILLPSTFLPGLPLGLAWCAVGRRWMASEGTAFFWGFDALVTATAGLFVWLAGASLVALAGASVVVALSLLRRSERGRTAALVLFVAAGGAAAWSLLLFPPGNAPFVLAGAAAGAILLFRPATSRDFGGRWGAIFPRRRLRWV